MSISFQVDEIEELLALMEQWGITEMHLTLGDASIDLVRARQHTVDAVPSAEAPAAVSVVSTPTAEEIELVTITAPVVGVYHLATRGFAHGQPQDGDALQAGQVIGIIELMHVPYDMVSPVSGVIEEIFIEDGAGVEYAQPVMSIRPFEEVSEDEAGMLPPPMR